MKPHPDPPTSGDGGCYVCQRKRPVVAVKHGDPFCSTECARVWHSKLARRLGLFPKPRTLIAATSDPVAINARELLWIAKVAVPQMLLKGKI